MTMVDNGLICVMLGGDPTQVEHSEWFPCEPSCSHRHPSTHTISQVWKQLLSCLFFLSPAVLSVFDYLLFSLSFLLMHDCLSYFLRGVYLHPPFSSQLVPFYIFEATELSVGWQNIHP